MALASAGAWCCDTLYGAIPWLAVFGASWASVSANLWPMALEIGGRSIAATFMAAMFVCQNVGGMIGPPLCGRVFDFAGSEAPLFVIMAAFALASLACVATLPKGYAEAPERP
jgi:hypothetical protein